MIPNPAEYCIQTLTGSTTRRCVWLDDAISQVLEADPDAEILDASIRFPGTPWLPVGASALSRALTLIGI